jgi:hypothetical protein
MLESTGTREHSFEKPSLERVSSLLLFVLQTFFCVLRMQSSGQLIEYTLQTYLRIARTSVT